MSTVTSVIAEIKAREEFVRVQSTDGESDAALISRQISAICTQISAVEGMDLEGATDITNALNACAIFVGPHLVTLKAAVGDALQIRERAVPTKSCRAQQHCDTIAKYPPQKLLDAMSDASVDDLTKLSQLSSFFFRCGVTCPSETLLSHITAMLYLQADDSQLSNHEQWVYLKSQCKMMIKRIDDTETYPFPHLKCHCKYIIYIYVYTHIVTM